MAGTFARHWRHFITDRAQVRRTFPENDMDRIRRAIADGETRHAGQVCFAVEAALPLPRLWQRIRPRHRALEVFGLLRVWDTEANDGVLLYLLLADRAVEIVADRGIDARVGDAAWQTICRKMESAFREGRFADGIEQGIAEISALLAQHSPRTGPGRNEIPDAPVVL
ncbi:MAG: TPM domain-containing protein [Betaproteobacteria bacterium]